MFKIYLILRFLLYPIFKYILPLFSKKAASRVNFEMKNSINVSALGRASYGFEVSSEGELEQVRFLIFHLLKMDETVEIIFCSDSVESQCLEILKKYPEQVRLLRLPILIFNPISKLNNPYEWLTCKTFFMCRYDFFPELIQYCNKNNIESILLSANANKLNSSNIIFKSYLRNCYKSFDKIICSTSSSQKILNRFLDKSKIKTYDFRINQIVERLVNKNTKYTKYSSILEFTDFIRSIDEKKKMIFGSLWYSEVSLIKELYEKVQNGFQIVVAPHVLSKKNLNNFKAFFDENSINYQIIDNENTFQGGLSGKSQVILIGHKGLLCELYSEFSFSYVGGGFGVSVHSLLEPYIGNNIIFCGPKTYRSTEYDFILEQKTNSIKKVELMSNVTKKILEGLDGNLPINNDLNSLQSNQDLSEILLFLNLDLSEDKHVE